MVSHFADQASDIDGLRQQPAAALWKVLHVFACGVLVRVRRVLCSGLQKLPHSIDYSDLLIFT